MRKRYIDLIKKNKVDFVFRPYGKILPLFIANLVYIFLLIFLLQIYPNNTLIVIFSTVLYTLFTVLQIKKNSSLLHHIEFQNALFANSLKKNTDFFLILNRKGEIVYFDDRSDDDFTNIEDFFKSIGLNINEIDSLFQAIHEKYRHKINIKPRHFVIDKPYVELELSPLNRPDGYFLLAIVKKDKGIIYSEMMENHSIGTYVLNNDGLLLSANNSFYDLIESQSNKKQISLPNLIKPPAETQIITLLNNTVNVYVNTQQIHDENGDKYTYGIISQKSFERAEFMDAPIAIAQFNKRGKLLKCNNTFIHSISNHSIIFDDIIKGNISFEECFALTKKKNLSFNIELINGKISQVFFSISVEKVTAYFFDITRYKTIEEQLLHSQKVNSIGELAGGIAHDFNNILTGIIGFCDLILGRYTAKDSIFIDLTQIKQSAERATNLVNKLLAFSRRQTLQLEVLDVVEILEGISPLIKRLIGEDIQLITKYADSVGNIKADKSQLEQVIMNLAINARDAMSNIGNITVVIGEEVINGDPEGMLPADPDEKMINGEYIFLEFIDTGTGIAPDVIKKIFNPFFSTKKEGCGTGLGLSTVYGITRQIGGYIYIHSIIGSGTTIKIYLPKVYEHIKEIEQHKNKITNSDELRSRNILFVEDEEMVRKFITRALRNEGYTVFDYSSSVEASKSFTDKKIDIIITDIIMPEISGVDMVNTIRESTPDLQVLFISGYSEKKLQGVEYGYGFLQKPFSLDQLISKVRQIK